MNPLQTPLQAEAYALKVAIEQVTRLGFRRVAYCTDSRQLVNILIQAQSQEMNAYPNWRHHSVTPTISDLIQLLSYDPTSFVVNIPRTNNILADSLAKKARITGSPAIVKWTSVSSP